MEDNLIKKLITEAANKRKKELIEDIAQSHFDAMAYLRECIRENVKDGWGLLPSFTPAEYCRASKVPLIEKDEYFIKLIDEIEMEYIIEDFKEFFGTGWSETFNECIIHIKSDNFKSIIPFLISALEKAINEVINKGENFFGINLKREYRNFVDHLDDHIYIKQLAFETKKVFEDYIFKNGIKGHNEIPIFNRNLIQHGNDTPDRWGKVELYKIISLIGGLIHMKNIISLSKTSE
ncbi:hypothetical protein [Anaerobacillus sp. 1_MG-2023]|uniref:hypothetical protein n=1 Tax=Anaerobacillus sp. 1_MG-2023 TaxID=3062655 RepID=UPI0026E3F7C6|nr:hypothetical protein [Anaerobacillus sp. 1_MG-2023]MDO6657441.1 hypothetical protein [Anaerobacillus sp. 1_MG-2023]